MPDTQFHEKLFPTEISYGSTGGPEWNTEVVMLGSGVERRNQNWGRPRERWNVAYGVNTDALLATLRDFFYARRGRAYGFRFKNHKDYTIEPGEGVCTEVDGPGDNDWQIYKQYEVGAQEYSRKIVKPVDGSEQVWDDSVLVDPADYTLDDTTGIITFDPGSVPASGSVVTVTCQFHVPMRFDTDHLPLVLENYLAQSADVPLVELKL